MMDFMAEIAARIRSVVQSWTCPTSAGGCGQVNYDTSSSCSACGRAK